MPDAVPYRLNFLVDADRRLIVIRPIGHMPGPVFVERLFEAYARVDAPWTYSRLNDFRRFEGYLDESDIEAIARRWSELAAGQPYHAHVAVVTLDALDRLRVPAASAYFPNETICLFADYHEAVGWLLAPEKDAYLERIRQAPTDKSGGGREDGRIVVE